MVPIPCRTHPFLPGSPSGCTARVMWFVATPIRETAHGGVQRGESEPSRARSWIIWRAGHHGPDRRRVVAGSAAVLPDAVPDPSPALFDFDIAAQPLAAALDQVFRADRTGRPVSQRRGCRPDIHRRTRTLFRRSRAVTDGAAHRPDRGKDYPRPGRRLRTDTRDDQPVTHADRPEQRRAVTAHCCGSGSMARSASARVAT